MTDQKHRVVQDLWDGARWHNVGQPYPPEGQAVDEATVARYHAAGFLATPDEIAQKANPEAHSARDALTQALAHVDAVQPLLALFTGEDGTPATPEQALEAARALQNEARVLREVLGDDPEAALRALTADRKALELASQQLTTLRALHPTVPGTDLPDNFVRRGALAKFGLTTYESLQGKTAAQLDAIEGVGAEQAEKILGLVATWEAKKAELTQGG